MPLDVPSLSFICSPSLIRGERDVDLTYGLNIAIVWETYGWVLHSCPWDVRLRSEWTRLHEAVVGYAGIALYAIGRDHSNEGRTSRLEFHGRSGLHTEDG